MNPKTPGVYPEMERFLNSRNEERFVRQQANERRYQLQQERMNAIRTVDRRDLNYRRNIFQMNVNTKEKAGWSFAWVDVLMVLFWHQPPEFICAKRRILIYYSKEICGSYRNV